MSRRPHAQELGQVIATFESFDDALAASATLRSHDFNQMDINIVGTDVVTVDKVRGRITAGTQFFSGFTSGLFMMMLMSVLLVLMNPSLLTLAQSRLGQVVFIAMVVLGGILVGTVRALRFAIRSDDGPHLRTVRLIHPQRFELRVTDNIVAARRILSMEPPAGALAQVGDHTIPTHPPDAAAQTGAAPAAPAPSSEEQQPSHDEPEYGVRLPRDENGNIIRPQ